MIAAWFVALPLAWAVPDIDAPVVDLAGVIDAAQEQRIAGELLAHRAATGVQMAVLVVRTTDGQEITDYAQEVFDEWGGGSAERNDGALFVLAIGDRRNRLHLGYGLEPVIPDALAKEMLDELRPSLKAGAYGNATAELVASVVDRTAHLRPGESIAAPRGDSTWLWVLVAFLALALGAAWGASFGKIRASATKWRVRGSDGRYRSARLRRFGAFVSDRRARLLLVGLVGGQAAIAIALRDGAGYVLAYSVAAWVYFGLGWLSGATPRTFGGSFGGSLALALAVACFPGVGPSAPTDALAIVGISLQVAFFVFLVGGLVAACVWAYFHDGKGGAHGSSTYSSSYTASSSSYATSSHATSSYVASSTSSYSGGGGSSGGGGASSSW